MVLRVRGGWSTRGRGRTKALDPPPIEGAKSMLFLRKSNGSEGARGLEHSGPREDEGLRSSPYRGCKKHAFPKEKAMVLRVRGGWSTRGRGRTKALDPPPIEGAKSMLFLRKKQWF